MGNLGRYACVALPFGFTLAAIIALLVATLGGVSDKSLFMFQVNLTDFQMSPQSLLNLVNTRSIEARGSVGFHDTSLVNLSNAATTSSGSGSGTDVLTTNKTAADLGFYNLYNVGLWGYCYTAANGTNACLPTSFNWAEKEFNNTKQNLEILVNLAGQQVDIPKAVTDAMTVFSSVSRWTEIAFVVALVSLGVELFFGFFANCSRALSCVTFLVAFVATVATCAAASLATALSVIVVGTVESTAKFYGADASFNTRFLVTVWIAAAFAIAAGFFWLFTICCCAPDHSARRSRSSKRHLDDSEKLVPTGAYQPIQEHYGHHNGGYQPQHSQPQYGYASNIAPSPRKDLAYEPYARTT